MLEKKFSMRIEDEKIRLARKASKRYERASMKQFEEDLASGVFHRRTDTPEMAV